jgi:hypothetical protein
VPVTTIIDALKQYETILLAAKELGCSRAYIYHILKLDGKRPKDYLKKE